MTHKGHDSVFDWSGDNANEIKWAAFYSDCEHEVLEVKSGHRITLTYNLYVSTRVGGILQKRPTASPGLYPLYEDVKASLNEPEFMPKGKCRQFLVSMHL